MKKVFLIVALLSFTWAVYGQKPALDLNGLNKRYPTVDGGSVSSLGNYYYYTISDKDRNSQKIYLNSIPGNWTIAFDAKKVTVIGFSVDETQFLYKQKDTLCLLNLSEKREEKITGIESIWQPDQKGAWLAYRLRSSSLLIKLRQLSTGLERSFTNVSDCKFNPAGTALLLQTDSAGSRLLKWIDLDKGEDNVIWSSHTKDKTGAYIFNPKNNKQLAFYNYSTEGAGSIWYYQSGMQQAQQKVNDKGDLLLKGWTISETGLKFTETGRVILFGLKKPDTLHADNKYSKVDIWNYKRNISEYIPLDKFKNDVASSSINCQAAVAIENNKITLLNLHEAEDIRILGDIAFNCRFGNPAFPNLLDVEKNENTWMSLITSNQGVMQAGKLIFLTSSPDGKYIVFRSILSNSGSQSSYYSFNTGTGQVRNIMSDLVVEEETNDRDHSFFSGLANVWLEYNKFVVYDSYDIWLADPRGTKSVNLTNGLGRTKHLIFRLAIKDNKLLKIDSTSVLMESFNENSKSRGLYRLSLNQTFAPEKIIDNDDAYTRIVATGNNVKKGTTTWLVQKEGPKEYPNYFLSHDLKNYKSITSLSGAEKDYNWLSQELFHFKQLDGKNTDGILYKPEDFDPHKKYPIIFSYYEEETFELLTYKKAGYDAPINIPYFVSRGYLVFVPDIHYSKGHPGKSAYNSVIAAVRFLSKLSYVNINKMGLAGHSFGGHETDYIVSHTNLFAAAYSGAGSSDMISMYGNPYTGVNFGWTEFGQGRMGSPPALSPQNYIDESAVFFTHVITTPILLMQNKNDGNTPFSQGPEFFIGLSRMKKKVWMLQYDESKHYPNGGYENINIKDVTIRITQFYDHYLKDSAAPVWMTMGVPARLKQIENGYSLDSMRNCGADCKVCKKINKEYATIHGTKVVAGDMNGVEKQNMNRHW